MRVHVRVCVFMNLADTISFSVIIIHRFHVYHWAFYHGFFIFRLFILILLLIDGALSSDFFEVLRILC